MMDLNLLNTLDTWIRQGRVKSARKILEDRLRETSARSFPRETLPELAALCRRTGIPEWSIRLLNPFVRPKHRDVVQASSREKSEYAAALVSVGAVNEARTILDRVPFTECAEADLYGAFARFSRWEYPSSLPLLERYLAHRGLDSYSRRIAEVNFSAALIATKNYDRADELLTSLVHELASEGHELLSGNAWTLLAQNRILRGDYEGADEALRFSESKIGEVPGFDGLLIRKWRAVWKLRHDGANEDSRDALFRVRKLAIEARHWETIRDCDFHLAWAEQDENRWAHLYFGTPYAAYRARIVDESGIDFSKKESYLRKLGSGPKSLDLGAPVGLKIGQVPHRLLLVLASDFYRPQRIAALHEQIFPGRFYNPVTSPDVVHQALKRLRSYFAERKLPLLIRESNGSYSLERAERGLTLVVRSRSKSRLEDCFGDSPEISRAEVARALGISSRSAYSLLNEAARNGELEIVGSGPRTRYRRHPLTS